MNPKRFEWRIIIRVIFLFLSLLASAFVVLQGNYIYLFFLLPLISFQVFEFIRFQRKAQEELQQFVEAIHYRDFSRFFDVKHAPAELQPLRQGFNEINDTFKIISKEKETQYQY
ncbi:MAG: ATP-binding protein, partial [Bacteroidota bacterium]|nr:ATP-binding protein [Bacteroidota bacterium]